MELKKLFTAEERAVSPVIAVVLMIAVTVILAAVVAAFALGLGGGADTTPQASFDFDWDATAGTITLTHEGGDALDEPSVSVYIEGTVASVATGTDWPDTVINTGEKYVANDADNAALASGAEVRVTWTGDDGQEATLATYTVP